MTDEECIADDMPVVSSVPINYTEFADAGSGAKLREAGREMNEWRMETRNTLLKVAIEAAGEQVRKGVAEADIEYGPDNNTTRLTLRRDPFRVDPSGGEAEKPGKVYAE